MYTFIFNKNSHKNKTKIVKTVMRIYFTSVDREHSDQSAYIECIFTLLENFCSKTGNNDIKQEIESVLCLGPLDIYACFKFY